VDAVAAVNAGTARPSDFDRSLAAIGTTFRTTAILEAGRRSLDGACTVTIQYGDAADPCHPTGFAAPTQAFRGPAVCAVALRTLLCRALRFLQQQRHTTSAGTSQAHIAMADTHTWYFTSVAQCYRFPFLKKWNYITVRL
jgi:hypothetical protein